MSSEESVPPPTEDRPSTPPPEPLTFTVKSNNDNKYTVSLLPTATIIELKEKLAGLADVPVDRQRLIYSGRVMKNDETLETYKVKSGNTVHMVKGAASNAASNPANASGSTPRAAPRLASGGNDPLNNITGARYAGHVQLPRAGMFGPDGGMGAPPNPEHLATFMQDPMFQAQMNELLSNPQMLDYMIQSNPMLQSLGPEARQLMQSDMFRQMMTNPDTIRRMMQMNGALGSGGMFGGGMGGGAGGAAAFPEPGRTDTTPAPAGSEGQQQPQQSQQGQQNPPGMPSADMLNLLLGGGGQGAAGSGATSPPAGGQMPNMQNLLPLLQSMQGLGQQGQPGAGSPNAAGVPGGQNPFAIPPGFEQFMQALGGAGAGAGAGGLGGGFPGGLGAFGAGGAGAGSPPPPADNRPPEERYADQLRQLNDMGFFDFDRNVEALRRSGGSVQGAVNQLLGG